jgi:IMP dehydrogenase/GMP reductase
MSDYDGVHVIPINGNSQISHRGDVNLRSEFSGFYPIMSSPMKGISGVNLVREMWKLNCLGILHRFDTPENRTAWYHELGKENIRYGVAIGIENWDIEFDLATCAYEHGATMIVVDIANGYLPQLKEIGKKLVDRFSNDIDIMAGNVVNKAGMRYLKSCGFNYGRIGIGSGNQCTTRLQTGIGRNQLMAIEDCSTVAGIHSVSDGGIDLPHKAVKSFVAGAEFVMLGSVLGKSFEADNDGVIYGMASRRNHILSEKDIKSIEGRETHINNYEKRPLKEIIDEFLWGIRSACTYLGADNYNRIKNLGRLETINYIPQG